MNNIGTVVDQWVGKDGNDWRGVRLAGGAYLVQRRIYGEIWI